MKETRKYKQTELGLLPEDWEVAKMGDVAKVKRGVRVVRSQLKEDGFFPVFQNTYIPLGYYYKSNVKAYTPFVIIGGSAGQIGISKVDYWAADDCAYLECGNTLVNLFLYYTLLSNQKTINGYVRNGTVPRLDRRFLEKTYIPLPPIEEQRRIASALTSIDNLIDSLDRLIAKKRDIKQGAMQQLLSGKKRLKGFIEPWVEKKLGDMAETASGGTPSRSNIDYYKGHICWFTTSELTDNYLYDSNEHITNEALSCSSAKLFPTGTLLIAMYGATIGRLGILCTEAATNQACCAINCQKIDTMYLFYLLLLNRPNIIELGCGAGQPNISQDIVKNLEFIVPSSLTEQQAIASVLTSMDSELSALEARRKKYEQIKQGMMQQLLTGRISLN